jgi:excisionase family DNA binding protein
LQSVPTARQPLTAIPDLDDLVRNPSLAENLAPSTVASLLGRARIATSALEARLLVTSIERQKPTLTNQEPPPARLMTAAAVADRLGFTQAHIYELARAGKIKSLRQGKYVRFAEPALLEYIASIGSPVDSELCVTAGREGGRKN